MSSGQAPYLYKCSPVLSSHWVSFYADLVGRNPGPSDAAVHCPDKSGRKPTLHLPTGT